MLNNLNSILIEGVLVRDPELKYTPKGTAVCSFSLASSRYFKQDEKTGEEVSYFDVTTWSRLAGVCAEYLRKGREVRVVGRLKQEWVGSDEPQNHVFIFAEHVEFKPQVKVKEQEKRAKQIILNVHKGIVDVLSAPEDLEIVLHDYDTDQPILTDENGKKYAVYTLQEGKEGATNASEL